MVNGAVPPAMVRSIVASDAPAQLTLLPLLSEIESVLVTCSGALISKSAVEMQPLMSITCTLYDPGSKPLASSVVAPVYISEIAPRWMREILKPLVELLGGLPSVVLGSVGRIGYYTDLSQRSIPTMLCL